MPTQSLQVGVPTVITQNVVYAMPARACVVHSSAALEISYDGSTFVAMAVSATNSSPIVAAPFVRCTTASPTVTAKPND